MFGFSRLERFLLICFFLLFIISSWFYVSERLAFVSSLPDRDSQRVAYDSLCPDVLMVPVVSYDRYWLAHEGLVNVSLVELWSMNRCVSLLER